eukprot:TRINITY_DN174_c0_g1_i1.p3 TRINITY_DN174_c0_g1~~TRINITY_DN174_c0_g1_i1.p3  ORF type:complete len:105 (+),score=41.00 TRINITY_DN174_c0_g1_i1:546-860(+)
MGKNAKATRMKVKRLTTPEPLDMQRAIQKKKSRIEKRLKEKMDAAKQKLKAEKKEKKKKVVTLGGVEIPVAEDEDSDIDEIAQDHDMTAFEKDKKRKNQKNKTK